MSWAEKCFHLLLELPNKPFKWSTMPIPWLEINCWKSENAKMTQNGLSSPKCIFWLQPYRSFKKSTRNLRGINYQMEHMCWAPHKHKNSLKLQGESQLHCTLYRSFIPTLYLDYFADDLSYVQDPTIFSTLQSSKEEIDNETLL